MQPAHEGQCVLPHCCCADVAAGLLTQSAGAAWCTTWHLWRRTAVAAAARRAVELLAVEALHGGGGPAEVEKGIEAIVASVTAQVGAVANRAVVQPARVVTWCRGAGLTAACAHSTCTITTSNPVCIWLALFEL